MHNFFVILLMFPLQEILCNRNVDFTNHKSDHLIKHYNQRELPPLRQVQTQWHNQAYPQHGQMLSSDRFISSVATDSNAATMTLTRPPPTPSSSMLAANTWLQNKQNSNNNNNNRFRRSNLKRPLPTDTDVTPPLDFLRIYFCGAGYQNCMYDERLNDVRVQHDFLKQIPRRAEITLPSSQIDWKSKELNLPTDVNIWNNLDLSGKREWPLLVEEPHYVLVRSDDDKTQHLGPDYMDDPFIPQRGRRFKSLLSGGADYIDDPFIPQRGLRFKSLLSGGADYIDDPFIPQRGRRFKSLLSGGTDYIDDPFIPQRGRRFKSLLSGGADYIDDPFIPQRGRRSDQQHSSLHFDPTMNTNRSSKRLTQKIIHKMLPIPLRKKRSIDSSNTPFDLNTIYNSNDAEMFQELHNLHKIQNMKNMRALKMATHLIQRNHNIGWAKVNDEVKIPNQLIERATVPLSLSSLNWCCNHDKETTTNHQTMQKQKRTFYIPYGLEPTATNNNNHNNDNNKMIIDKYNDAFNFRAANVQPSNNQRYTNEYNSIQNNENQLNNLSQENRDALYLARGSQTPYVAE